jgi:hypothetical protein
LRQYSRKAERSCIKALHNEGVFVNKFHKTNGKNELKELHKFISESKTDRMIRVARKKEGTWTPLDEKNYNQNPVGANLRFDETSSGKKLFQKLKFWNSLMYKLKTVKPPLCPRPLRLFQNPPGFWKMPLYLILSTDLS